MFEREQEDLLCDLKDIPRKACDRRVRSDINLLGWSFFFFFTQVIAHVLLCASDQRVREEGKTSKIHAYIIGQLKKEMPAMIGKVKTQQRLIDTLEDEFGKVKFTMPNSAQ